MAARLDAAGIDATVTIQRERVPALPGQQEIPFLQARLALRAQPAPFSWELTDRTIIDVITRGTAWVTGQPGQLTGYTGVWWPATDPDDTANALIARASGPWAGHDAWLTATDGRHFRSMLLTPWMGYVDLSTGTPPTHTDLDELIDLMLALAGLASYGFIRTVNHTALINAMWGASLGTANQTVREPDQERVEQSAPLPVTPVQLARLPEGTTLPTERWCVSAAGDLSLIVARDLDAWLTGTVNLEQAHADLAALAG
jgi:hypothetical protein